jgi:hypothetical protein
MGWWICWSAARGAAVRETLRAEYSRGWRRYPAEVRAPFIDILSRNIK